MSINGNFTTQFVLLCVNVVQAYNSHHFLFDLLTLLAVTSKHIVTENSLNLNEASKIRSVLLAKVHGYTFNNHCNTPVQPYTEIYFERFHMNMIKTFTSSVT